MSAPLLLAVAVLAGGRAWVRSARHGYEVIDPSPVRRCSGWTSGVAVRL